MFHGQSQVNQQVADGIGPGKGRQGVHRQSAGQQKQPNAEQNRPPLPPIPGVKQIQGPHSQGSRKEHYPHNPQVGQQAHPNAQQDKSPQGVLAESPFQQVEGNHQHTEKGQVFAVDIRVVVDAGVQQENQQYGQGQQPVVEQAASQPVAKVSGEDKEQVGEEKADGLGGRRVIALPQIALGQQQRQLRDGAIDPVVVRMGVNGVGPAQDIIQVGLGQLNLVFVIHPGGAVIPAIIFGQKPAGQQEKAANQQPAMGIQEVQGRRNAAGKARSYVAQRREHRGDYSIRQLAAALGRAGRNPGKSPIETVLPA